jgi:hypothetical protein
MNKHLFYRVRGDNRIDSNWMIYCGLGFNCDMAAKAWARKQARRIGRDYTGLEFQTKYDFYQEDQNPGSAIEYGWQPICG